MSPQRKTAEPAFVLQSWPWSETSLIVEFLTMHHGKAVCVARGAQRPSSHFRGMLSAFLPLGITYSGKNEVKNLTSVSWIGGFYPIEGDALFLGFYANEIISRLLAREDPAPDIFAQYVLLLKDLSGAGDHEPALRTFEARLLKAAGYGMPEGGGEWFWDGAIIRPYRGEELPHGAVVISEEAKEAIARFDFSSPETLSLSKKLFRAMINYYAGAKPLQTRKIVQELKRL